MTASHPDLERRLLQVLVAIFSLVPIGGGLAGVIAGSSMVPGADGFPPLDSHVRYLSGLLLALGLGFWSTVPAIEQRGARFALLTALVVAGGLARLFGLAADGWPSAVMVFALFMELAVTPALYLWQRRVARRSRLRVAAAYE